MMPISMITQLPKDKSGKYKWAILILNLCVLFLTLLSNISFGRLLPELIKEYPDSVTIIFWAGSIGNSLPAMLSYLSLIVYRRIGFCSTIICAIVISTIGLLLVVLVNNEYMTIVGYGLLGGSGAGLLLNTLTYKASNMFPYEDKQHVLATGLPQLIYTLTFAIGALLTDYLVPIYGWRITLGIYASISAFVGTVVACISVKLQRMMKPPIIDNVTLTQIQERGDENNTPNQTVAPEISQINCKVITLITIWTISMLLMLSPMMLPYVSIVEHVVVNGLEEQKGAILQLILAVADLAVTIPAVAIGDRIFKGRLRIVYMIMLPPFILINILAATWTEYWQMAIYCGVHGAISGLMMALLYPLCSEIIHGRLVKELYSISFVSFGIGIMLVVVVSGYIFDSTGSFVNAFYMNAGLSSLGLLLLIILYLLKNFNLM